MAQRTAGPGRLTLMLMNSLEPPTIPEEGSPELFQTGESFEGSPLVDRQHAHDLFMNLSTAAPNMSRRTSSCSGSKGGLISAPEVADVGALTAGYLRDFDLSAAWKIGIGADLTVYRFPSALEAAYGEFPVSGHAYIRLRWGKPHGAAHAGHRM